MTQPIKESGKESGYVAFLEPIEEVFPAWRRKVHDQQPSVHRPLLQAMEEAGNWHGCDSGMDKMLKAPRPSMSGQGGWCL